MDWALDVKNPSELHRVLATRAALNHVSMNPYSGSISRRSSDNLLLGIRTAPTTTGRRRHRSGVQHSRHLIQIHPDPAELLELGCRCPWICPGSDPIRSGDRPIWGLCVAEEPGSGVLISAARSAESKCINRTFMIGALTRAVLNRW